MVYKSECFGRMDALVTGDCEKCAVHEDCWQQSFENLKEWNKESIVNKVADWVSKQTSDVTIKEIAEKAFGFTYDMMVGNFNRTVSKHTGILEYERKKLQEMWAENEDKMNDFIKKPDSQNNYEKLRRDQEKINSTLNRIEFEIRWFEDIRKGFITKSD